MAKINKDDLSMFEKICRMEQMPLKAALEEKLQSMGYETINRPGYLFAEGDVPVLLVAHMDTVHKTPVKSFCVSSDGIIMSPQGIGGDDRCGVYLILKMAERHKCSIVFCEDEEIGTVGAKKFSNEICKHISCKDWKNSLKYIIEFDRRGLTDAVFYSLDSEEFEKFIEETEYFKSSVGSFSDISEIAPALGIAAVNFSSGYFREHSDGEYVDWFGMHKILNEADKIVSKHVTSVQYIYKEFSYGSTYKYSGGCDFYTIGGHPVVHKESEHWRSNESEYWAERYDAEIEKQRIKSRRDKALGKRTDKTEEHWLEVCEECGDYVHYDDLEYVVDDNNRYIPMCKYCYAEFLNFESDNVEHCIECADIVDNEAGYGICTKCLMAYDMTSHISPELLHKKRNDVACNPNMIKLSTNQIGRRCDFCRERLETIAYVCSDGSLVCSDECYDETEEFIENNTKQREEDMIRLVSGIKENDDENKQNDN